MLSPGIWTFLSSVLASFPAGTLHMVAKMDTSSPSLCSIGLETSAESMCLLLSGSSKSPRMDSHGLTWTMCLSFNQPLNYVPGPGVRGWDRLHMTLGLRVRKGILQSKRWGKDARKTEMKGIPKQWAQITITPGFFYSRLGAYSILFGILINDEELFPIKNLNITRSSGALLVLPCRYDPPEDNQYHDFYTFCYYTSYKRHHIECTLTIVHFLYVHYTSITGLFKKRANHDIFPTLRTS